MQRTFCCFMNVFIFRVLFSTACSCVFYDYTDRHTHTHRQIYIYMYYFVRACVLAITLRRYNHNRLFVVRYFKFE